MTFFYTGRMGRAKPRRRTTEFCLNLLLLSLFVFPAGPAGAEQEKTNEEPLPDLILPDPDDFLVEIPEDTSSKEPKPPADTSRLQSLLRESGLEAKAGNHEAAVRLLTQAREISPYSRSVRLGLGTSLLAIGQYPEAETLLLELADEFENDHVILNNLAWLYATARDIRYRDGKRALHYARRALLVAPSAHYVWSTLAEAYYVSGQYEQAVRAAEQALLLADERGADARVKEDYQRLLEKSRYAARAFEILD